MSSRLIQDVESGDLEMIEEWASGCLIAVYGAPANKHVSQSWSSRREVYCFSEVLVRESWEVLVRESCSLAYVKC